MFAGIEAALDQLGKMPGLRAVVLSGEGRGFCAGLDMASFANIGAGEGDISVRTHGIANLFQHVAIGWRALPVPVIAAVHGVAFGGGFQVMLGSDIRIAAPDTRLSIMEIKWGLVPDMGGIALLRTLVRDDAARELTYTGKQISGDDAAALGIVTRTAADPHAEALALAQEIASKSPDAVRGAKRLFNAAPDQDTATILVAESVEQAKVMRTPNQIEAVMANMEKRAPVFRD
jgi:enoyl-CoA hydratase/carnithine racemase